MFGAKPQPSVSPPKLRSYQYSLRTLMLVVTLASIGMSWVAWELKYSRRYLTYVNSLDRGEITVQSVYCVGPWGSPGNRRLVYAFARTRNMGLTSTNYRQSEPAQQGIHWWSSAPDGLWINGEKALMPSASPVFAILDDGRIVPIPLADAELRVLAKTEYGIYDRQLIQKLRAPFQKTAANTE